MVSRIGCQGTRLTQIQFATNQNLLISSRGAALKSLIPKYPHISQVSPFQAQNQALALVQLHAIGDGPALWALKSSPNASVLLRVSCSSLITAIHKLLAWYAFKSCIQII